VELKEFYLANMVAGLVSLFGNQGRALWASASLAARYVSAGMNANRLRCGIEIGLKHKCGAFQIRIVLEILERTFDPSFLRQISWFEDIRDEFSQQFLAYG
jgi:hypothetical protein